jgi:hypothetical protein
MRFILLILIFFIIGGLFIISNNNLFMYQQGNVVNFVDMYLTWLNQLSSNLNILTGNVIKLDWIPSNQ